jgi:predicted enzyme related to lactoylglutathione lyase
MGQPVVHFEIGCRDKERTAAFYRDAFGWEIDPGPMGSIRTGPDHEVGGHVTALGHEPHNYVAVYVSVPKLEEAIERVEGLGGKKLVGPIEIPSGRFAWIADIEGTMVGLLEGKAA